jgi:hypothetical protein
MNITFDIGTSPAEFHRDPFTGRADLVIDGQKTPLASPLNPATHFNFKLTQVWQVSHGEHTVEIEKVRPQVLGGFRPHSYVVKVDGEEVTTARGF